MPSYDDEGSIDDGSLDGNHSYNAKALAKQLSSFDDRFGSNDLTSTTGSVATNQNGSSVNLALHDSHDSLYFDGEEEKKQKPVKKGEPSFNQGGALEMLMSPPAKKKPSTSKGGTMMLPKTMSIKARKEATNSNMSSKVTSTLDKLGSQRHLSEGERDRGNVDAMWGRLGNSSALERPKHRRAKSNPMPDLTDEIGFIVEAGSPEALGNSSHRGGPTTSSNNEIPRSSRRGGRRGQLGSSTHQQKGEIPSQSERSPAARKRSGNRRRANSLRASSHGPGDRSLRASSHGPGEAGPLTPGTMRRRIGTPTTPGTDLMSQSAHVSSDTPARRRLRRSGSIGSSIDMPFNSPEKGSGSKESVNAANFLSPSKGVMNNSAAPPEGGGKRQVMRGRRPGSVRGGDLSSSQHGQAAKARSSGGGRRRRSRDPAAVNAGVN